MHRSVYANCTAFIRTSKEISDLEGELLSTRNLLSTQATLVHNLAEGVHIDSLSDTDLEGSAANKASNDEVGEPSDVEKWSRKFPDFLNVLLAGRRVDEALASLDEGERIVSEAKEKKTLTPGMLLSLQSAIIERRQKLADQLAQVACQPSSSQKTRGWSSCSYFTPTTRDTISDSLVIFGKETACTSEVVMWASKQTEAFAHLVKRHALASSAAAGGLRSAAECIQIALGHCSLLESHGLSLCPVLMKLFRPSVEQALDANLKRIEESTAALAAADDWELTYPPTASHQSGRTPAALGAGNPSKIEPNFAQKSPLTHGIIANSTKSMDAHVPYNPQVVQAHQDTSIHVPIIANNPENRDLQPIFESGNSRPIPLQLASFHDSNLQIASISIQSKVKRR
ncbi:exocyst complex component EXO84B [Olea europaea subsp. europaea]|uniref:Exocyst complex component EXO84B n=1 Tax=Olea europaea subsp. europaea TaxID=158383 RepID=A0A8S0SF35_OLEEU|nr:exocyst complex component EXO84B [Olea europaea subsp. europaea]